MRKVESRRLILEQFHALTMGIDCAKTVWTSACRRGKPSRSIHSTQRPEQNTCAKTAGFTPKTNKYSRHFPQLITPKYICFNTLFLTIHMTNKNNNYSFN